MCVCMNIIWIHVGCLCWHYLHLSTLSPLSLSLQLPSPPIFPSRPLPHTLTPAASKRSHQGGGVSSKDVKARYEKQLSELKVELKSLKLAGQERTLQGHEEERELRCVLLDLCDSNTHVPIPWFPHSHTQL